MGKTEISKALEYIHDAEIVVAKAMKRNRLTRAQRSLLSELADCLRNLVEELTIIGVNNSRGKFKHKKEALLAMTQEQKGCLMKLKRVANVVYVIIDMMDCLERGVDIISKKRRVA